jgi:hypothetical protein
MFIAQILMMLATGPVMLEDNLGPYTTKIQCETRLVEMVGFLHYKFQENNMLVPEIKTRCQRDESTLL